MRILESGKRFSFVGILCGLFLLAGVLQADVTTTWTIQNGYLYADGIPVSAQVVGNFTFDSTTDTVTSINMQVLNPDVPITITTLFGGDSTGLLAYCDSFPCGLVLNFLPYLPPTGGTVGINPDPSLAFPSGLYLFGDEEGGELAATFNGAYVTSPEPSIPVTIFLSTLGMVGLVYARRRRSATQLG